MGTVHEFRRKPANKGQFEGPVPGAIQIKRRPRRSRWKPRAGLLALLAWVAIIAAVAGYAVLT